jgi:putative ATP-dependent endonuclease of OLD family
MCALGVAMQVKRIMLSHFRGVATGSVSLEGHSLLVGGNSVGKSTICEALDLILGPERLARRPVVDEHDFHLGNYLEPDGATPEIRIEVLLGDLSTAAQTRFISHVRRWSAEKKAFLDEDVEADPDAAGAEWVLPVVFLARYDADEDDFLAGTFFAHPYSGPEPGDEDRLGSGMRFFGREDKRFCGFLYLRPNRTGNRALSFERGSLLDTIVRLEASQSGPQWEGVLDDLRELDAAPDGSRLGHIRSKLETQVSQFMTLSGAGRGVDIKGSEHTREHLREVLRLFVRTQPGNHPVPFNRLSTGSLNVLVFAMLTYIAELKGESSVIFAIEEPEIALPPHGQRRLLQFAMSKMGQVIVTSHSPYVIERFQPGSVIVVRREDGALTSSPVGDATALSLKKYRQHRRQFAEAVLARAVLVVEGATEASLIPVVSDLMASELGDAYDHVDIAGVSIFDANGDAAVPEYAGVFKALGKPVFGVHDQVKDGLTSEQQAMTADFHKYLELPVTSVEVLLQDEVPAAVHRRFLKAAESLSDYPQDYGYVTAEMEDAEVLELSRKVLLKRKGSAAAYARLLVEQCQTVDELPASLVGLLQDISDHLRRPAPLEEAPEPGEDPAVDDGTSGD